jgi:hypothetical protein
MNQPPQRLDFKVFIGTYSGILKAGVSPQGHFGHPSPTANLDVFGLEAGMDKPIDHVRVFPTPGIRVTGKNDLVPQAIEDLAARTAGKRPALQWLHG